MAVVLALVLAAVVAAADRLGQVRVRTWSTVGDAGSFPPSDDMHNTFCPECRKPVVERKFYTVDSLQLHDGKCMNCDTPIAGVWS